MIAGSQMVWPSTLSYITFVGSISLTDAIMMSFPAPEDPPMIATIKLGTIAKHRVKKFRTHGVNFKSRNPYNT